MKKRFKLITTVASLCLAVALMAFGVYAASTSTVTVASKVSFEAQVDVEWTWKVVSGANNVEETARTVKTATKAQGSSEADIEWNGDDGETTFPTAVEFYPENGNIVVYEFTCVNKSTTAAHVDVTATFSAPASGANWTVAYFVDGATSGTANSDTSGWGSHTIAATGEEGDSVTFRVEFTLISAGAEVFAGEEGGAPAETAFEIQFVAAPGEAE